MAYCGMKKEDIEDTSMNRHWKPARPAAAWNPFGQLPPPQHGEDGEEESARLTPRTAAPPTVIKAKSIEQRMSMISYWGF